MKSIAHKQSSPGRYNQLLIKGEGVIMHSLHDECEKWNVISGYKFGFRPEHSCEQQAEKVRDEWSRKNHCIAPFLDIEKTFNKIWHEALTTYP